MPPDIEQLWYAFNLLLISVRDTFPMESPEFETANNYLAELADCAQSWDTFTREEQEAHIRRALRCSRWAARMMPTAG